VQEEMKKRKLQSKMILQVHDELVFDVLKSEIEEMKVLVKDAMENAVDIGVPTEVQVDLGDNWLDAH